MALFYGRKYIFIPSIIYYSQGPVYSCDAMLVTVLSINYLISAAGFCGVVSRGQALHAGLVDRCLFLFM